MLYTNQPHVGILGPPAPLSQRRQYIHSNNATSDEQLHQNPLRLFHNSSLLSYGPKDLRAFLEWNGGT